jgi:hypothetical protein
MFYIRTFLDKTRGTLFRVPKQLEHKNISGRRIASARKAHNPQITQDALSGRLARLGIHLDRAAIAKIETNRRSILDYELKALAELLDVDVNWLLGGTKK